MEDSPTHKRKFDLVTDISVSPEVSKLIFACSFQEVKHVARCLGSLNISNLADHDGCTPQHYACSCHDAMGISIAKFLLSKGPMVNVADHDGATALHYAASGGQVHLFSFLLGNYANPYQETNLGDTLLHSVIGRSHTQARLRMADRLLYLHADPNQPNNQVNSPTKLAFMGGHVDLAYKLMAAGGRCNTTDENGLTLLHHLAIKDLQVTANSPSIWTVACHLVQTSRPPRANVEARDNILGSTPMHLAR